MVNVPWKHELCILCLLPGQLTCEHVIPKSLGGILTSRFLCKPCNDRFGGGFEAQARLAPELRRAAASLGPDLTKLTEAFEVGARYRTAFGDQALVQTVRPDGSFGEARLPDGSHIVAEEQARDRLVSMLNKSGAGEAEVAEVLERWATAAPDEITEIGGGLIVRKWQEHPSTPVYSEPALSPLVPLKIAYEFAALILYGAVLRPDPGLERLRKALVEQDEGFAAGVVSAHVAPKPAPFHGVAFQGNRPVARFQIRLFGLLAYEVMLPGIVIDAPPLFYIHRLDTGEDQFRDGASTAK